MLELSCREFIASEVTVGVLVTFGEDRSYKNESIWRLEITPAL